MVVRQGFQTTTKNYGTTFAWPFYICQRFIAHFMTTVILVLTVEEYYNKMSKLGEPADEVMRSNHQNNAKMGYLGCLVFCDF